MILLQRSLELAALALLAIVLPIQGCSGKNAGLLPLLTDKQEAREKDFIRAHYFDSACLHNARSMAPELKDKGAMIVPAYTVELGLTEETRDGKMHTIEVAEDHRLAYFQDSKDMLDARTSPVYGPVSIEPCLKDVLTWNADNCRAGMAECR